MDWLSSSRLGSQSGWPPINPVEAKWSDVVDESNSSRHVALLSLVCVRHLSKAAQAAERISIIRSSAHVIKSLTIEGLYPLHRRLHAQVNQDLRSSGNVR